MKKYADPPSDRLLPDLPPHARHVRTLVLDLDDVLVHSDWTRGRCAGLMDQGGMGASCRCRCRCRRRRRCCCRCRCRRCLRLPHRSLHHPAMLASLSPGSRGRFRACAPCLCRYCPAASCRATPSRRPPLHSTRVRAQAWGPRRACMLTPLPMPCCRCRAAQGVAHLQAAGRGGLHQGHGAGRAGLAEGWLWGRGSRLRGSKDCSACALVGARDGLSPGARRGHPFGPRTPSTPAPHHPPHPSQYYELVVYTSQLPTYADPIMDRLDPQRLVQYR